MSEDDTESETEEKKDSRLEVIEVEDAEGTDEEEYGSVFRTEEDDDDGSGDGGGEEDYDYDEVLVNPRSLNEVTSLTDKTSPWTSVLSDPDLVSLGSLEAPEPFQPELSQDEEDKSPLASQTEDLHAQNSSGEHECTIREESQHHQTDSFNGSSDDDSETEDNRTPQTVNEGPTEPNSTDTEPDDTCQSPTTEHAAFTHDPPCSRNTPDPKHQQYP